MNDKHTLITLEILRGVGALCQEGGMGGCTESAFVIIRHTPAVLQSVIGTSEDKGPYASRQPESGTPQRDKHMADARRMST